MESQASHLKTGETAETLAKQYLLGKGLLLVEQNFRALSGEIDLIMMHDECLVFIEVRYRKSQYFSGALESITSSKQAKIRKTALYYLQKNANLRFIECRFDVIAATGKDETFEIQWLTNAFQ